jgi:hypothetical protein
MNRTLEDAFSGQLNTSYHHDGRFADERARYLHYLGERGWKRETLIDTACKLAADFLKVAVGAQRVIAFAEWTAAKRERPIERLVGILV